MEVSPNFSAEQRSVIRRRNAHMHFYVKQERHDEPLFLESVITDLHYHRGLRQRRGHEYAAGSVTQEINKMEEALNGAQRGDERSAT